MVSSSIDDFLGNVIQEAIRTRAYLCLISHLVSPDESNEDEGVITPARLMWNHFAAIHNSNRAVDQCAVGLSERNEGDGLIASALTKVVHLLDFMEEKITLISIAETETNEKLETAVRAQATFEMLGGSWRTIRRMFQPQGR